MRAILTLTAAVITITCFGQQKKLKSQNAFPVYPKMERTYNVKTKEFGDRSGYVPTAVHKTGATSAEVIGGTTYDLQSNGSIPRRLFRAADGTMIATWTMSNDRNGLYMDRGTGYNFYNGVEWRTAPAQRIETSQATGWGQALILPDGSEFIVSHNSNEPDRLHNAVREVAGTGTWTEEDMDDLDPSVLWPRMAIGGTDGNTIHLLARTESSDDGTDNPVYNGLEGALLYSRSEDGGQTWVVENIQLPGMDTTNYVGMSGDSYAIDARGKYVAIVYGGLMEGVVLWKSENNGATWDQKVVLPQFIPKFREDVHNTAELFGADTEVFTGDGSCEVIIDEDGLAHVFYGIQFISNDDVTDELLTFNPGANGIDYWNENQEGSFASTVAASIADPSAFQGVDNSALPIYGFSGMASMPTASIGEDGCIYLAYAAMTASNDLFQFYRHMFGVRSCDGGASWSYPIDLTQNESFRECVFGSAAATTDNKFRMIYQRDLTPGMSVSGDEDAIGPNDIVYAETDIADFGDPVICQPIIDGYGPLCGEEDSITLTLTGIDGIIWSTGETTASITVSEPGTYGVTVTTPCGDLIQEDLPVEQGGLFEATISTDQEPACDTATGQLSVSVQGPEMDYYYLWSNGATSDTITGLGPGYIFVQVVDTMGCVETKTATLDEQNAPTIDSVAASLESCHGALDGRIGVFASGNGPLSFDWGDQFPDTNALDYLDGGTYLLIISDTLGCEESTVISIEGGIEYSLFLEATDETCAGPEGTVDLNVISETVNPFTFIWSNGLTTEDISGLAMGTYSVTVEDVKGCAQIDSIEVAGYTAMSLDATVDDQATIGSILLNVQGGNAPFTYQWNNGSNAKNLFTDQKGNYVVIVTDAGGCSVQQAYTLNGNVGLEELTFASVELFPNPATDLLNIKGLDVEKAQVVITNSLGQMVKQLTWTRDPIALNDLENGVYQIRVLTDETELRSGFVVRR